LLRPRHGGFNPVFRLKIYPQVCGDLHEETIEHLIVPGRFAVEEADPLYAGRNGEFDPGRLHTPSSHSAK
jgi:hypothetical protein